MGSLAAKARAQTSPTERSEPVTTARLIACSPRRPTGCRGFSLLEVVISIAVLAILAGMILPRLGRLGKETREVPLTQLESLLATLAYRDIARTQTVGLYRESGTRSVGIVVREVPPPGEAITDAAWYPDALSRPMILPPGIELVEVLVDDEPIDPDAFLIALAPGSIRPTLAMTLAYEGGETTVVLPATSLTARRQSADSTSELLDIRAPIDLDGEGRDQDPW